MHHFIAQKAYSQVSRYSLGDYKFILDDSLCDILERDVSATRNHAATDVNMVLMALALVCSAISVYYSTLASLAWSVSMPYVVTATCGFFVFSIIAAMHAIFIQGEYIFDGVLPTDFKSESPASGSSAQPPRLKVETMVSADVGAEYKAILQLQDGNKTVQIERTICIGQLFTDKSGKLVGPTWYAIVRQWLYEVHAEMRLD